MEVLTKRSKSIENRRGVTIVYTAVMLTLLFGMAAFAIEVGMMMVARTNMQSAADSAALAGVSVLAKGKPNAVILAKQYASFHSFLGAPVILADEDIKFGFWNEVNRTFTEDSNGNAIEVIARVTNASLVFAKILGTNQFSTHAVSVAVAPARDIVFVVDLSGSMNDDTEPVWATKTINDIYSNTPYAGIGNSLVQNLYNDLGYGSYPGMLKHIGFSLGVPEDRWSYAEMTKDFGVLDSGSLSEQYRILPSDDEWMRKEKCYRYIIDYEIAIAMPNALPAPDSSVNYEYWAKYLDYVITSEWVHSIPWDEFNAGNSSPPPQGGGPEPPAVGGRTPQRSNAGAKVFQFAKFKSLRPKAKPFATVPDSTPIDRGWIPPVTGNERIYNFNNPNSTAFTSPDFDSRWNYGKKLGYLTYVNFMQDFGRDGKPDGVNYTPLSVNSPFCPFHQETTDGGEFMFPPGTQPMHSCRRSLIGALNVIKERNANSGSENKDQVAIITYDRLSEGTKLVQALTDNYQTAMQACTTLQASSDVGQTTATEIGLSAARNYIEQARNGGLGRNNVNKVVVVLTDGIPNAYESNDGDIEDFQTDYPNANFYAGGYHWLDAPLMQTKIMSRKGWQIHPVGIGFGTDYEFMDRMARVGGTAQAGQSLRGSGNPALYEQRLRDLFEQIVEDPMVNLTK